MANKFNYIILLHKFQLKIIVEFCVIWSTKKYFEDFKFYSGVQYVTKFEIKKEVELM